MKFAERLKRLFWEPLVMLGITDTFEQKNADGTVLVERYYNNGQLREKYTCKDGKENGPYEAYYDNGQLRKKGTYKDGKENGPYERYDENGQLTYKGSYKDGKENGPYESYHVNGQLEYKGSYKDGKQDGLWEHYYYNGQLRKKCTYRDGKENGPYESYYENGQLKIKCTYKDGTIDGLYECYNDKGQLDRRAIYRDGKELTGQEAEDYLRLLERGITPEDEQVLIGLKERLIEVNDLESTKRSIKPARTSERTDTAARITRVRRARDILAKAAQKAQAERNEDLVHEIIEIAKPYMARLDAIFNNYHDRRALRRAKAKGERG